MMSDDDVNKKNEWLNSNYVITTQYFEMRNFVIWIESWKNWKNETDFVHEIENLILSKYIFKYCNWFFSL